MPLNADDLLRGSSTCRAAEQLISHYCSTSLYNHSLRSFRWGIVVGDREQIAFDAELLFVSAMLHDIALTTEFDNYTLPFEAAGGHIAQVFAAGAGWAPERGVRAAEIIERHMWPSVDPAYDAEGYLLEVGTGIDISGSRAGDIPAEVRDQILRRWPRNELAREFAACFHEQARRKPGSRAAATAATVEQGLQEHPFERL